MPDLLSVDLAAIMAAEFERTNRPEDGKLHASSAGAPLRHVQLAVDHNHNTGEVRGLLCYSCNTKLGFFELNRGRILEYAV